MNKFEIEKDIRRFLQNEFYLEGKTDDTESKMQYAASRYVQDKFPEVNHVIINVDYFGDIKITIN